MALKFTKRTDSRPGEHARLPIQLERLPFATLDATDNSRTQLSLSLTFGNEVSTWEASAGAPDTPAAVLPGPFGNDLWVALGRAWNALYLTELDPTKPDHRTITLSYGELIRLMGKSWGRPVYEAIEETVTRLRNVLIVAQGTWKDGEYIREQISFPLFDMTRIRTRRDGDVAKNTVTFRLSIEVAQALVRHSRLLDTRQLYRLTSNAARRLYRLLEAERFNRDRRGAEALTLTLNEIRDRLPLSETKPAQIKRTIGRAHAELQAAGILLDEPVYTSAKLPGVRAPVVSVTYRFPASTALEGSDPAAAGASAISDAEQQQLASLLGVSATPGNSSASSDLAWWIREIERTLGDTRSSGFYKQVVEAFLAAGQIDALEFVLRGVERDGGGMSGKALGAAFTARVKARSAELAIVLPGATERPKRGTGIMALGELLPPSPKGS